MLVYCVPLMAPTSIDLFAGCGGLSLGLEKSGFKTVYVNELHPTAMETFVANRPGSLVSEKENQSSDILDLTQNPARLSKLSKRLWTEHGDITLVSGGPPCQGFSGIGHRRSFDISKDEIPSNYLYKEMSKFVSAIGPKAFLFENVKGLLTSRWTRGGDKGEIWEDVKREFENLQFKRDKKSYHYRIGSALILGKHYGVPQNRPRVLMVGIRSDINVPTDLSQIGDGFLPRPTGGAPDLENVLGDLVDHDWIPGGATRKYLSPPKHEFQRSMRRMRDGDLMKKNHSLSEQEYSKHRPEIIEKFQFMLDNNGDIPEAMRTKKFAQRVLPAKWGSLGPSITATSLPDDFVHYLQPRTPTVREWARLQTFPDWYQFAGRRTTGGRRRAGNPDAGYWFRDLPKYTQIGNAVPVTLGEAIGRHLIEVLSL